jgi:type VI secretion system protein ImpK
MAAKHTNTKLPKINGRFVRLVNQINPPKQQNFRQRRTTTTNKNLLVATANKLFTEIAHLKRRKNCNDPSKLHKHLLNEIQKFQIKAENLQYDTDNILIGRYALSATIDETILQTSWGIQAKWQDCVLLQELQQDANANEHFFTILERICRAPNKFLDNIELMYICLSLGFEGKFRHNPQEKSKLQKIIDTTYQIIRAHRGEIDKRLSPLIRPGKTYQKKRQHISIWPAIIITTTIIMGIYYGFNHQIKIDTGQLIQQIQHMENHHAMG